MIKLRAHCLRQPPDALVGIARGAAVLGVGNILSGMLEGEAGQLPLVRLRPGRAPGIVALAGLWVE